MYNQPVTKSHATVSEKGNLFPTGEVQSGVLLPCLTSALLGLPAGTGDSSHHTVGFPPSFSFGRFVAAGPGEDCSDQATRSLLAFEEAVLGASHEDSPSSLP